MERPYRCPVCNAPLEEDKDAGFKIPPQCPYLNTAYPELCSLHDKLYFWKWRKMEADPNDIKRAFAKLGRLLSKMKEVVEKENLEPARQNLKKAGEAFAVADVDEDPYSSIKHMDQALSYIHHAINDLLQEKRRSFIPPRTTRGITMSFSRSRRTGRVFDPARETKKGSLSPPLFFFPPP